jgi:hypothetical protein
MKKNLSEQLADNLAYYVNDPNKRCASEMGMCYYSGKTAGKNTVGCFVGRLMKPKDRIKADDYGLGSVYSLIKDAPSHGMKLPKIIIDNKDLMGKFQALHDSSENWDEKGLNADGKIRLRSIISIYELELQYFEKFLAD